jgi:hypothetical protein
LPRRESKGSVNMRRGSEGKEEEEEEKKQSNAE